MYSNLVHSDLCHMQFGSVPKSITQLHPDVGRKNKSGYNFSAFPLMYMISGNGRDLKERGKHARQLASEISIPGACEVSFFLFFQTDKRQNLCTHQFYLYFRLIGL